MAGAARALRKGCEKGGGLRGCPRVTESEEIEHEGHRDGDGREGNAEQQEHQRDLEKPGKRDEERVAEDVEWRGPTSIETEGKVDIEALPDCEERDPKDERAER